MMKRTLAVAACAGLMLSICGSQIALGTQASINKKFKNKTGEPRNDLRWWVEEHVKDSILSQWSDVFPNFDAEEYSDTHNGQVDEWTTLIWSGATVEDGSSAYACVKMNKPVEFYKNAWWSNGGLALEPVAGCASTYLRTDPELHVVAPADTEGRALDVFNYGYAVLDSPLDLSELTVENPTIPWVSAPGSVTLSDGQDIVAATITADLGQYVVWKMSVNFHGDPLENTGYVITQEQLPEPSAPLFLGMGTLGLLLRRVRVR
jgi:hypothetical protein